MNTTFSALLSQLLSSSGISTRDLYRQMKIQGSLISYQALASYKAFDSVPRFERASEILRFFNYDVSESQLQQILDFSRHQIKALKSEERKYVQKGIRLSPSYFSADMNADELEVILSKRMLEIGTDNINSYIAKLVRTDLVRSGYIADKQENDQ